MKIDWVLLKRSVLSDISEEERNLLNAWLMNLRNTGNFTGK